MFRGARVPDSDRVVVALGGGYALRDNLDIDFSHQHYFFKEGRIINRVATASRLIGAFDLSADWFALGVTLRFCRLLRLHNPYPVPVGGRWVVAVVEDAVAVKNRRLIVGIER